MKMMCLCRGATWPDDIHVAVNVSSVQLTNKNLVNVIIGAIASAGIPANRLGLEITESVFFKDTFANIATLKGLRELGVEFAMDDFGTGYSSLGYLLSFPFGKIKIDRSFITGLPDKKESSAIVRAVADLARSLNMRVTAEGVETAQQLEQIRILGRVDGFDQDEAESKRDERAVIGQRHHRTNTRDRHQAPAHLIIPDDGQQAAVLDDELLA
jgi:EAL domain-containing protein (putative c-di-GMP-specific phosphodiesterase class I)